MQNFQTVIGMILKTQPIDEYDRKVVILTKENGKITVYAKGARRQNNRFMASMNPFCFGEFKLFVGRRSYSLEEAEIQFYFEELRNDYEAAYYGMYFLEIADYYARENNDEKELLKLLFQSVRALTVPSLNKRLIRSIFEIKAMMINGEFKDDTQTERYLDATVYTISFIRNTPIRNLYSFQVSSQVLQELSIICKNATSLVWDKQFKSLDMIEEYNREDEQ